jgi:transposase
MPGKIRRHSGSDRIQPSLSSQANPSSLRKSPAKKKELSPLQEAIRQLRVPLEEALTKGYSYRELANILQQQGISISGATLKTYLTSGRQEDSRMMDSNKFRDRNPKKSLEEPSSAVEVFLPAKTEISSYRVGGDFWSAYQESLREREEVYRRLAES